MVHSGRPKKLTLNTAFERPVSYDLDTTSHWLCAEQHPRTVTLTQWNQFPRVNRCCPGIPHRRFVLRIFPGVFCTSRSVLHRRGVLHQRAFYAFFRACFAPAGRFADLPEFFSLSARFTAFAGVFHTASVFRGTGCSARGRVTLRRRAHPAGVLRIPGAFGADGNGMFLFFGVLNACDLWSVSRRRCVFFLSPRGCYSFNTPVFNKTHPPRLCFITRKVS
jgi:hypothetical protein